MSELLLTSSVLIVLLLILRLAFRRAIPCRVQYALWALVLVRLLVPVNLPAVDFSVLTAAQEVNTQVETQLNSREVYVLPLDRTPADTIPTAQDVQPGETVPTAESFGYPVLSDDGQTVTRYADKWTLSQVLTAVWAVGAAAAGIFFLAVNLRFWRKLCKARIPYTVSGCGLSVYLVEEGLPSPACSGSSVRLSISPPPRRSRNGCTTCCSTSRPMPGREIPSGPLCGACAWHCTGLIPWCGRRPPPPGQTANLPATSGSCGTWGRRSAWPTAGRCWP